MEEVSNLISGEHLNFGEIHQSQKFITYCTNIFSFSLLLSGMSCSLTIAKDKWTWWRRDVWAGNTDTTNQAPPIHWTLLYLHYNWPPTQFPIPVAFFILLVYSLVTRLPMRCQDVGYVKDSMFRENGAIESCTGHCSYISQLQNPCFQVPPIIKINSFLCSIIIASTRLTNRTSQSTYYSEKRNVKLKLKSSRVH
jgi:hypothetical protein